jgi:integrase
LFRRARYQLGSLLLEKRRTGSDAWVYRWREKKRARQICAAKDSHRRHRQYPTESAALTAVDALRLDINSRTAQNKLVPTTVHVLWEHYSREELPDKKLSTQDSYSEYWKNWISPRWGTSLLEEVKTVEAERWLKGLDLANGFKAKIKCVMSALFSHAVRWEFCDYNPISSGVQVGSGGKRGPSVGVRISAKRRKAPLALSPEQVMLGLNNLEFRDQLLVFLLGALGTRRGELGALRWLDCDFAREEFRIEHSYYWRRGGHLKTAKTEASAKPLPMHPALKEALLSGGQKVVEHNPKTSFSPRVSFREQNRWISQPF